MYLVLILSMCHTRVVLHGIMHVCNFFFNDNVYKMILHVFSSWVCDLLDILKINLSTLVYNSYFDINKYVFVNQSLPLINVLKTRLNTENKPLNV